MKNALRALNIIVIVAGVAIMLAASDGSRASYVPGISSADLSAAMSGKQDHAGVLDQLSGFPSSTNKMIWVGSSGSLVQSAANAFGIGLLSSSDATSARTAIGAGTSSFDGAYSSLTGRPTIPSAQVQTDWNASSGLGVLLNKPSLFSGAYADLTGKPSIPTLTSQLSNDSGFLTSASLSGYATSASVAAGYYPLAGNPSGFLTGASLSGYLTASTAASTYYPLTNPSGFITASSLSGYVPTTATVNGHALSSNVTVTASDVGAVTSVTGTSPVVSSGGATPAISMAKATSSVNGYLGSSDWSLFNGKFTLPGGCTTLQLIDGTGACQTIPVVPAALYSTYQAKVTQSGTSNPSATQLANSFAGGTTFTWARTGTGTYTITASGAVFTAGKTQVFFGPLNNALGYVSATMTSTTVITVSTTVTSILSLVLTTGASDAMMTNMPVDIRVYP